MTALPFHGDSGGARPNGVLAVITDDRFGDAGSVERPILEAAGVRLEVARCTNSVEVAAACRVADAVLTNLAPLDAAAIGAMERCVVIARYGVGLDSVDCAQAAARGIAVRNVPGYCDAEVAEHSLGLILALARRIPERDAAIRVGRWDVSAPNRRVAGSTLGILGFGGTGRALARAALGLGLRALIVYSPHLTRERLDAGVGGPWAAAARGAGLELEAVSFEELLCRADWLSLHAPLTATTRGMIDEAALARMKPGACLINTARGGLVDEAALAAALASGRLGGAGLDVFAEEPLQADSPLRRLPNVVFSDHAAYASTESIAELRRRTAENALEELKKAGRV